MIDLSIGRWWDRAWTLVSGCTRVSPGCDRCWLLSMANRFRKCTGCGCTEKQCKAYQAKGAVACCPECDHTSAVTMRYESLGAPMKLKTPQVLAVWSDLFHEGVSEEFQLKALSVMSMSAAHHIYVVLTKRPHIMRRVLEKREDMRLDNIWFMVTAEDQKRALERIPILQEIPAINRGLSIEPMLGPIDLSNSRYTRPGWDGIFGMLQGIGVVICGGETGPGARPAAVQWVRDLRDQCRRAYVPFFFKGWGSCGGGVNLEGNQAGSRELDGVRWDGLPWLPAGLAGVGRLATVKRTDLSTGDSGGVPGKNEPGEDLGARRKLDQYARGVHLGKSNSMKEKVNQALDDMERDTPRYRQGVYPRPVDTAQSLEIGEDDGYAD